MVPEVIYDYVMAWEVNWLLLAHKVSTMIYDHITAYWMLEWDVEWKQEYSFAYGVNGKVYMESWKWNKCKLLEQVDMECRIRMQNKNMWIIKQKNTYPCFVILKWSEIYVLNDLWKSNIQGMRDSRSMLWL